MSKHSNFNGLDRNIHAQVRNWSLSVALIAALGFSGAAFAKQGADDVQTGMMDDKGGKTTTQPSDDPAGDDKGGMNSAKSSDDPAGDDKGGGNGNKGGKQRLRVVIGDDSTDPVAAKLEYKVKKGLAQFKASLKLALPSAETGIVDQATAEDAVITVTFLNGTAPYAQCEFGFDRITPEAVSAKYAIAVKQVNRKGTISTRQNKGSCDVDLATDGVQVGVPPVQSGDEAVIEFQPADLGALPVELGRGTF